MTIIEKLKVSAVGIKKGITDFIQGGIGTSELIKLVECSIKAISDVSDNLAKIDQQSQNLQKSIVDLQKISDTISKKADALLKAANTAFMVSIISLAISIIALVITFIE